MLRQALAFPVRGPEGGRTFVLGGVTVFGLLLGQAVAAAGVERAAEAAEAGGPVPELYYGAIAAGALLSFGCYLLLVGFAPRALAAAARGDGAVPAFGSVPALLAAGGKLMAVKAGYLFPGLVLAGVARGLSVAPLSGLPRAVAQAVAALSFLGFMLYMVTLLYAFPAAATLYGLEGSVRAAFDAGRLREAVVSEDYAVGWVVGIVVFVAGSAVSFGLVAVVAGVFVLFHANVAARYCYGTGVGRSLGLRERAGRGGGGGDGGGGRAAPEPTDPPGDPMAAETRDW